MNDKELQVETGIDLIFATEHAADPTLALGVFPQLLNIIDNYDISDYETERLMWTYKWVISDLTEYPNITKTQMLNALEGLKYHRLD